MTEPGAIDCDVHPSVPDVAALLPHLETFWRDSAVERGLNSLELQLLSAEIAAHLAAGMARQERPAGGDRQGGRRSGVRPLAVRHGDPQLPLRRAASVQRGHGGGVLPRAQRLHRQGMARPRSAACAPPSSSRCRTPNTPWTRSSAAPRTSASCRCWCWRCRRCRSDAGISGRSTRPASATACRSASMPAPPIATR